MANVFIEERICEFMIKYGETLTSQIYEIVKHCLAYNLTESDFRHNFAPIIQNIALELEIPIDIRHEYTVLHGRVDTLYSRVILEYKRPGLLSNNNKNSKNRDAIEEVQRQIKGLAKKESIEPGSILGIVFDGKYFIYVKYASEYEPENVSVITLEKFLKKLFCLATDKAVTVKHLVDDFGVNSKLTQNAVKNLYTALVDNVEKVESIRLLFEQWKCLFREVSGYSFSSTKLDLNEIKNLYGFKDESISVDSLIFSIHTYYALLIKLLSIDILYHNKSQDFKYQKSAIKYESKEQLFKALEDIESGGRFAQLGITNFLEGDFFGWYLNVWSDDIFDITSKIVSMFETYDYETVNLDEDNSRDLLKNLYNFLLPKKLRHALGEYYSPDWLAKFTYDKLGINGDVSKLVLDPCVGSGTFIVIAINEAIQKNPTMDRNVLLQGILANIHGYDLNPLAVIAARANYIIALDGLINETSENIEIPIYLCDSMLTVLEQEKKTLKVNIIATRAGTFEIPKVYIETGSFNKLLELLNDNINRKNIVYGNVWGKIVNELLLENSLSQLEIQEVKELTSIFFSQLIELEHKGIRKVWSQVIKNAFAPLYQKQVDYIIGNPPWVNWQTLPEEYRKSIQTYWYQYCIFDHKGLEARLGKAHDDISVLFTYVVMDKFLKDNGKLGFIINQNLLQASGGGDGFRKFKIKGSTSVKVTEVDDFVDVQPFAASGASNKTAVIFIVKGQDTEYPVKYNKWSKLMKGIIDSDELLNSVLGKIECTPLIASPIKISDTANNSPWMISNKVRFDSLQKLVGNSSYKARKGIDTSANGIYWVEVLNDIRNKYLVRSTPENSKKIIPQVTMPIEKDLVYPLVRGKDLRKWKFDTPFHIIVPYEYSLKSPLSMDELRDTYPLTYDYFYNHQHSGKFTEILETRGTFQKHYKSLQKNNESTQTPIHALYNIGVYTSAPYKVIWKALQNKGMNACVISEKDGKLVLPDHNNVLVPFQSFEEAHYLCGILNSRIVEEFIDSYISWFKSTHILDNINIPTFDNSNITHIDIARCSTIAHEVAAGRNGQSLPEIEKILDKLVLKLLS
ncbi:MAG: N-6 DNA methylase [Lutisporaceae bacterium]